MWIEISANKTTFRMSADNERNHWHLTGLQLQSLLLTKVQQIR